MKPLTITEHKPYSTGPQDDTSSGIQPPEGVETSSDMPVGRRGRGSVVRRIMCLVGSKLPTLLVLGILAGTGYFGHRYHWRIPKFATLLGNEPTQPDDWCPEHGVPESQCVECHPHLLPQRTDFGWCREHGVQNCPLHHPEVAELKTPPVVLPQDWERAARAQALQRRTRNNSVCKLYRRRLQFASLEAVRQAGLDVAIVERQPIQEVIESTGEVRYDSTRLANLSSRASGTVWRVEKQVGDPVQAGDVLALIDAKVVGSAKMRLIEALASEELQRTTSARLEGLSADGIVPGRRSQEADAAFVQARASVLSAHEALVNLGLPVEIESLRGLQEDELVSRVRFLGLPESIVSTLDPVATTANLIPVRAPLDGVVIERAIVEGEVVGISQVVFQVADTRTMWIMLNIPLERANQVALGQAVHFLPDGASQEVRGHVTWISTTADQRTRTVRVRAELPNRAGQLRNETFGHGQIILRDEPQAIVVPNSAIHWEGCCHVVFVRDRAYFDSPESPKVFHVRTVLPGAKNQEVTEILAGVLPGEVVAAGGSDVLRAQLLKNNLGEGCCAAD